MSRVPWSRGSGLNFTPCPHKTAYFSNNSHDARKNGDASKFRITKLNPWKLSFRKQPIIAGYGIKLSVILATKYKAKANNFIILIFYFSVSFLLYIIVCCNTSTFSFFIDISFLFEDYFKASKEQVTVNKCYINFYILVSGKYSAVSNSNEASGGKM